MTLKTWTSGIFLTALLSLSAKATSTANLDKGVILKGYDPVSYFHGKPVKGLNTFQVNGEGVTYLFANEKNKSDYLKDPKKYQPAYEGWCATAVAKGYKYDIDPENFKITDGRLFLFYKGWKGDAKKDWVKDESGSIKEADKNWPQVKTTEE